jgi:hypothetical protein
VADNFLSTAKDMFEAADALRKQGHFRNSCYLYGYVVECYYKLVLKAAGSPPRIHELDALYDKARRLAMRATARVSPYLLRPSDLARMTTVIPLPSGKQECHWDPNHRYDGVRWTERESDTYFREARKALGKINQMRLAGLRLIS